MVRRYGYLTVVSTAYKLGRGGRVLTSASLSPAGLRRKLQGRTMTAVWASHPRVAEHLRARRLRLARRLGRRGHQDRARQARRRHAGPGLVGHRGDERDVHVLLEHPTGARASASASPPRQPRRALQARRHLRRFLTNKLPGVRQAEAIDVEQIRPPTPTSSTSPRHRPGGERGPEADKGAYDSLAYWCRAGVAMGHAPGRRGSAAAPGPGLRRLHRRHDHRRRDHGALFHRERTGEATTVDVSLLSVGIWSMGGAGALAPARGCRGRRRPQRPGQPLVVNTCRPRTVASSLAHLPPSRARYWAEACEVLGIPRPPSTERFAEVADLMENKVEATRARAEAIAAERTADEWRASGRVQRPVGHGAGHHRGGVRSSNRGQRLRLGLRHRAARRSSSPPPGAVRRAARPGAPRPEFNEHGDAIPRGSASTGTPSST